MQRKGGRTTSTVWGLLLLAGTVSLLTIYQVHIQQPGLTPKFDPYLPANSEEDDREMQQALVAIDEMNAHIPPPPALTASYCHAEPHAEYDGRVVRWGADYLMDTWQDCCGSCTGNPECNIWVYCGTPSGCGNGRIYKECWLKANTIKNILDMRGHTHPGIGWTSGSVYDPEDEKDVHSSEQERLKALVEDTSLPMVWLDIGVNGNKIGRIKIVLFSKNAPRAAENFRAFCTGEKGTVPEGREGAGKKYHFKGAQFYRIIDRFIDQTGANTESIFGGAFKDDPGGLKLKHDRKGLLSMANAGPDTNTSHFSILMAPAPHLDGHYTVFGEIVEGFELTEQVNALARGKPQNTAGAESGATILDAGQIRPGTPYAATSH